jgi:hypothetical protein
MVYKKKNITKLKKQKGGTDVVTASIDVINSMIGVGKSIFAEINSIANIKNDIDNVSQQTDIPGSNVQSPPPVQSPV